MDLQLQGKRALVTGSSSGLGEAIAARLAAEGAEVVVHGRDESRTSAVAQAIRDAGGAASHVIGTLATDAGADEVFAGAGPVDVLVNNVGRYDGSRRWPTLSSEDWADLYNVNVISSVRMVERFLPAMRARGWGRVIQISSVTGARPSAAQPHYAATNAARINLAMSLARELRHSGVTSNVVAPGAILTRDIKNSLIDMGRGSGWGDNWAEIEPELVKALMPNDVGTVGRPDEYSSLVAYIASPLSSYITGALLAADGGSYDWSPS